MDDDNTPARRGRPPKTIEGDAYLRLLDELGNGFKAGSLAQACERAGTSYHVVKKAMRDSPMANFQIRLACMMRGRKRLCDGGADPALLWALGKEAEAIEAGDRPRAWPEIQEAIRRRQEMSASFAEARSRAGAQVTIPPAQTPEEENF